MARPRLTEGAVYDGFTIGPLLHRGGMAMLHEVTHPDHPGPLLMKVPLLFEGEDPAAIVSFEMEQMIMPRLYGPHVPRFIAAGDFSEQPFIVMERIPGTSLLPRIATLPLPAEEVAAIASRIATALEAIHRQHVVHLDVKPSNILLRESGEAVLIDFGLSHHLQLPDLMEEEFRLPYGTAPYMAPEQVMGVRDNPRSDLFALGALMYFFATGTRPFGDPLTLQDLKRRIWLDPAPPRALNPAVPPWLQETILRCLEVDPARRHPSAAQLAFDLRNPDHVAMTPRAAKLKRDGWRHRLRRRFDPDARPVFRRRTALPGAAPMAPILVVALDIGAPAPVLEAAMRATTSRLLATLPAARVACVNVQRHHWVASDSALDGSGRNRHVQRLVALRHWAAPLGLPEGRVTFHVLEAADPAAALLDYATANAVDHIILGARPASFRKRLLGGISSEVVAQAPCSVTVVRPRAGG
ncbi:serine/threonine protein kinase [Plastoroseomonas hellenica]|uniref:serine/threonine protein kinase n=1 Tax=Plastoroseomonas hellenica TaxID=2687306 RepID=UPI001BA77BB9|nr:protein kinase [Plastoroseomonas hellenica]MBR0644647.1 protein kinase [Plastoroseomonas hellenica]